MLLSVFIPNHYPTYSLPDLEPNPSIEPEIGGNFILYGEEGELAPPPTSDDVYVSGDKHVFTRRAGPWFLCMTSYTAELDPRRWIQDRQNFFSLYHDDGHAILGGGNTKLQPLWSTFTVGDVSLLKHKAGEENPNFTPPKGIVHVPTSATLDPQTASLILDYAGTACAVQVDLSNSDTARVIWRKLMVGPMFATLPPVRRTGITHRG